MPSIIPTNGDEGLTQPYLDWGGGGGGGNGLHESFAKYLKNGLADLHEIL